MKLLWSLSFLLLLSLPAYAQTSIGRYDILELDFPHTPPPGASVWEDVALDVHFQSPTGGVTIVGGFYFSDNLWKVRFVPTETGLWTWTAMIRDSNSSDTLGGSFTCIASTNTGFIRQHPGNPHRWIREADGSLFPGLGFGDCMGRDTTRSVFGPWGFDGGIRPPVPHGEQPGWNAPFATYLTAYGDVAGMNLVRISDGNCAFSIKERIDPSGNRYNAVFSRRADTICAAFRAHGFRVYYDIGGTAPPFTSASANSAKMAAARRWVKYCVDRWSAYVDFWELMNERSGVDPDWYTIIADAIRAIDPYHHTISTSFEQPAHPAIDIISPHWYGTEAATASDLETKNRIGSFKSYGKPIIYGEQGNSGRNWDSTSALRMRGRIWSAFFNEGSLIFWNSSYARDNGGGAANMYLGAEERRYVRALQTFAANIDSAARIAPVTVQGAGLRGYGLRSPRMFAAYLHSGASITAVNAGTRITIDAPVAGTAAWYDVSTGRVVSTHDVAPGTQTLDVPDFVCDIAVYAGAPLLPSEDYFPLELDVRDIQFDSVAVGSTKERLLTIVNSSDRTVTLTSASTSGRDAGMFDIVPPPLPLALAAHDSIAMPVRYRPAVAGGHGAHAIIAHDGSPVPEYIAVSGIGTDAVGVASGFPAVPGMMLGRNYPNPASGVVSIDVATGDRGAWLVVSDLFGREAARVPAGDSADGRRTVHLDVSGLAEGAYVYVLITPHGRIARMMFVGR